VSDFQAGASKIFRRNINVPTAKSAILADVEQTDSNHIGQKKDSEDQRKNDSFQTN